ncbi:hypothetical protein DSO57_1025262 [Entomophthora muscae]|uniref:Uncharacterized protein n=1 Tax=Entomophthora muscae TaxID=34485 RepID=A0ACC2SR97_9FUNG|nr:hypothetical protein DSO57_1025262 [Entomophthora muscae]
MFGKKKCSISETALKKEDSTESHESVVEFLTPEEQVIKDEDAVKAVHYFFNNQFDEAQALCEPLALQDPAYCLVSSALKFFRAILTFDDEDIKVAIAELDKTYELAQADIDLVRPPAGILGSMSKLWSSGFGLLSRSNNTDQTPSPESKASPEHSKNCGEEKDNMHNVEFRARNLRAESLLLNSLTQLFQESIVSYVKAGLNLRKGYLDYQSVHTELKKAVSNDQMHLYDANSISGVYFGIGATNIVLSILPAKILKIISVLGIKGDRQLGFEYLDKCIAGEGLRAPLGLLFVLMYHSLLLSFAPSFFKESSSQMETLLTTALSKYPDSSFFHLFHGRYLLSQRKLVESNESFIKSGICPESWPELKSISTYEIGLTLMFSLDWEGAAQEFKKLADNNYWSKALFIYLQAACYTELNQLDKARALYDQVENASQRKFGGKTISVEQFILRKVRKISGDPQKRLILPGLEIIAIWNGFACMPLEFLQKAKAIVEKELETADSKYLEEDPEQVLSFLHFVHGAIAKEIPTEREAASESFKWIFDHPKAGGDDTYILPFAFYESGVLAHELSDYEKCRQQLTSARDYSGEYNFEYRLALRIHLILLKLDSYAT